MKIESSLMSYIFIFERKKLHRNYVAKKPMKKYKGDGNSE